MRDRDELVAWIDPRHLDDATLGTYRQRFADHPARMVVLDGFLVEEVAARLSLFLRDEGEFCPEHGLYSAHDGAVAAETWHEAPESDRFFRYGRLVGTPPEFMLSPNALTYLQFRHAFQSHAFRAFFEQVSGLALGSSDDFGAHRMVDGDYLRPHADDNRNRRLALVLYLTPGWEPAMGGSLHLVDASGGDTTIGATYNRLVAFDVLADTLHHVDPVTGPARLSIGGWYPQPADG